MMLPKWVSLVAFGLGAAMFIAGAIMLGIGIHKANEKQSVPYPTVEPTDQPPTRKPINFLKISQMIQDRIDGDNVKQLLRQYTKLPHQAGTDNNLKVAQAIKTNFEAAGLENVHFIEYEVLLSYPDWNVTNKVSIMDAQGHTLFQTTGLSPVINSEEQSDTHAGHQWLAYSKNGKASGKLIYANYGHQEDFDLLKEKGVDIKGTIALMRYGSGFRGNKVQVAEANGCLAALLMSDPADAAVEGWDNVYNKSVWMPNDGVQRGSVLMEDGDPLTPRYPAKNYTFRSKTVDDLYTEKKLPNIQTLPVSYNTGNQLMKHMGGPVIPEWQGGLNMSYRCGPTVNGITITVDVRSSVETKKIRNVVGYIKGATEPDRYVILGNHYDAWVYGSLDPNSGTAVLSEVARAFVQIMKESEWRPRRTIVFANWDAEEYGLMGSNEFTEEFSNILQDRAVIYLNMDCFMGNHTLWAASVPMVYDALFESTKSIENPVASERALGRSSVYDTWFSVSEEKAPDERIDFPEVEIPAANTDHAMFIDFLGVPVIDFTFKNKTIHGTYPLYHSMYETPFVNEHLYDTDNFAIHKVFGKIWTDMAIRYADSPIIPLNVTRLAELLNNKFVPEMTKDIKKALPNNDYTKHALGQTEFITETTQIFFESANAFDIAKLSMTQEAVNSRLMKIERCFIVEKGIGPKSGNRHILFSISEKDSYAGRVMASIYDALSDLKEALTGNNESLKKMCGDQLAAQISVAQYSIWCAINTLKEFI